MGKIKKILETELVGGTQSTDVYPVTSTKAVYDENNVRLDTILKPATEETAGLMSPEDKKNIDDKLSKSEGGEVNKPIVITNKDSDYSTTINPDGSIYIWDKKLKNNILHVQIDKSRNVINIGSFYGSRINIDNILNLVGRAGNVSANIYDANTDTFTASKFKLRTGTDTQILLGDGSTTSKLVSYLSSSPQSDAYIVNILNIDGAHDSFTILGATKELAGLMTATDKTKLDDVPNIYAKKSKTISNITVGNRPNKRGLYIAIDYADRTNPGTTVNIPNVTTTSDGCMSYEDKNKLDHIENTYISSQNGQIDTILNEDNHKCEIIVRGDSYIEDSSGRITLERTVNGQSDTIIDIDAEDGSINADSANFVGGVMADSFSKPGGTKNEVWSTDGGRINVLNLLSNAAIYVAGGFELAESGIDNTTVIDNPDRIIYDETVLGGRFLATKGMTRYTHWKADISKNIAPPSRYGIETDYGVFPFNNQMYKFSTYDDIFIATCSNGTCTMKILTLE